MDIHIGGQLVETLSEPGPEPPEQDKAPPTSEEDEPDTGEQTQDVACTTKLSSAIEDVEVQG